MLHEAKQCALFFFFYVREGGDERACLDGEGVWGAT